MQSRVAGEVEIGNLSQFSVAFLLFFVVLLSRLNEWLVLSQFSSFIGSETCGENFYEIKFL
jgi:hypothetical protein